MLPLHPKKRQRMTNPLHLSAAAPSPRLSSTAVLFDSFSENSIGESPQKLRRTSSNSALPSSLSISFNDPDTADVILRLFLDPTAPLFDADETVIYTDDSFDFQIYLHSEVLNRAKYPSALLSDRWKQNSAVECRNADAKSNGKNLLSLKLGVPRVKGSIDAHLTVLELLYADDFSSVINSVSAAL